MDWPDGIVFQIDVITDVVDTKLSDGRVFRRFTCIIKGK